MAQSSANTFSVNPIRDVWQVWCYVVSPNLINIFWKMKKNFKVNIVSVVGINTEHCQNVVSGGFFSFL